MHDGLKFLISKFFFNWYIPCHNRASADSYNYQWLDKDNDNLWQFIEWTLWINYIEANNVDDTNWIDARFQMTSDYIWKFDFKSGFASLEKWFSLYLRDFNKKISDKWIFYFKKIKDNSWMVRYWEVFYYISPKQFFICKEKISEMFWYDIFLENPKFKDIPQNMIKEIKEYIEENNRIKISNELSLYINFDIPDENKTNSRINKPLDNSIRISFFCPKVKEYSI